MPLPDAHTPSRCRRATDHHCDCPTRGSKIRHCRLSPAGHLLAIAPEEVLDSPLHTRHPKVWSRQCPDPLLPSLRQQAHDLRMAKSTCPKQWRRSRAAAAEDVIGVSGQLQEPINFLNVTGLNRTVKLLLLWLLQLLGACIRQKHQLSPSCNSRSFPSWSSRSRNRGSPQRAARCSFKPRMSAAAFAGTRYFTSPAALRMRTSSSGGGSAMKGVLQLCL